MPGSPRAYLLARDAPACHPGDIARRALGVEAHATVAGGLVFTSKVGTPLFLRNVSRRFHQLLDAASIDRRGMHTTRHTTATLLLAANEHPKVVEELLGHSQISLTLDTYSHVMPCMREAAAIKLTRLLTSEAAEQESRSSR